MATRTLTNWSEDVPLVEHTARNTAERSKERTERNTRRNDPGTDAGTHLRLAALDASVIDDVREAQDYLHGRFKRKGWQLNFALMLEADPVRIRKECVQAEGKLPSSPLLLLEIRALPTRAEQRRVVQMLLPGLFDEECP